MEGSTTETKGKSGMVKHVLVIAAAFTIGLLASNAITWGVKAAYNRMRGGSM